MKAFDGINQVVLFAEYIGSGSLFLVVRKSFEPEVSKNVHYCITAPSRIGHNTHLYIVY